MRTFTITVHNVVPTLNLAVGNQAVNESDDLILPTIATFTDPGLDNTANPNAAVQPLIADPLHESFAYFIDWGDGRQQIATMPVADMNGGVGVPSSGSFGANHNYADDGVYTVTIRIADDNMSAFGTPGNFTTGENGVDYVEQTFTVTVSNLNPAFVPTGGGAPFTGTPVTAEGVTTISLSFTDFGYDNAANPISLPAGNPLAETFTYIINWGDGTIDTIQVTSSGSVQVINGQTSMLTSQRTSGDATTMTTGGSVIQHTYLGPPDPLHPTADIVISVTLVDDNGGTAVGSIAITNPGIQSQMVAIDTTVNVPRLVIPEAQMVEAAPPAQLTSTQSLQRQDVRTASSELTAASERYWELRVVYFDGTEGEGYRLKDEALNDLRKLFSTLPDDQYAIYVVRTENNSRRLVMVVTVRRGRLIDVSDDSEGTRDRPPTGEQSADEPKPMPLQDNPLLDSTPGGFGLLDPLPQDDPPPAAPVSAESGETTPEIVDPQAFVPPNRSWRWAAPLAGLALAAGSKGWTQHLDQALQNADDRSWQRLRRAGRFGRSKRNDQHARPTAPLTASSAPRFQSPERDKYNGNSDR
jgi:large repetitive protein